MINIFNDEKTQNNNSYKDKLVSIINDYKVSGKFKNIQTAENYYNGIQDILQRKRTVIDENGFPKEVLNIPNNKIVDNLYAKLIDQKTNYLLSLPITFQSENEGYEKLINTYFDMKFHKILKNVCEDSLKFGMGYVFVNYNEQGKLSLKVLSPLEVIPIFSDDEEENLIGIIRFIKSYDEQNKIYDEIEVYDKEYMYTYIYNGGKLYLSSKRAYFFNNSTQYSFDNIPIICFKYNKNAIPLINRVKSLQDGINKILSDFQNNMEEDSRNTVLILQNFDGTNLSEFRKNLSEYGVVKVKTIDGQAGDVRTLSISVNADNYKTIIDLMKKAIIENGRGFDFKTDTTFSSMNKMNIKSLYTDIDLDARGMEAEFTNSLLKLIWFIDVDIYSKTKNDYFDEKVKIIFNKDTIVNESDVIEDCVKSVGIIDAEIITKNHPWT